MVDFAVKFMVECPVTVRTFLNLLNITTTCIGANLIILHLDCIHALGDIQYTIYYIYIYIYIYICIYIYIYIYIYVYIY